MDPSQTAALHWVPFLFVIYLLGGMWGIAWATWRLRDSSLEVKNWEVFAVALPFVVWGGVTVITGWRGKTLGNLLDPFWVGVSISVLYLVVRWRSARRLSPMLMRLLPIVLGCVLALGFALFAPGRPE